MGDAVALHPKQMKAKSFGDHRKLFRMVSCETDETLLVSMTKDFTLLRSIVDGNASPDARPSVSQAMMAQKV